MSEYDRDLHVWTGPKNNKILVLGHGRHGKDSVAESLQGLFNLTFCSSSWACAEVLKPTLDLVNGPATVLEHFGNRHQHRELWKALIALYTESDKASLAKLILKSSDVYVGMRDEDQYLASKHLFGTILWVDAAQRTGYVDPTMDITYDPDTMIWIDNNGAEADLPAKVVAAMWGRRYIENQTPEHEELDL